MYKLISNWLYFKNSNLQLFLWYIAQYKILEIEISNVATVSLTTGKTNSR